MNLTRKQLNSILTSLPDPRLVLSGQIEPVYIVQVCEEMAVVKESPIPDTMVDLLISAGVFCEEHRLTFEFSEKQMDWVLKELVI